MLVDDLEEKHIGDGLILIRLPDNLNSRTSNIIGESFISALAAIGKNNPVLLISNGIKLEEVSDEQLKELGLCKIDKTSNEQNPIKTTPKYVKSEVPIHNPFNNKYESVDRETHPSLTYTTAADNNGWGFKWLEEVLINSGNY
jgi:hypothetical protein